MPIPPDVINYASDRTPRRPIDWLRLAPFVAMLSAGFAWMKSRQYHQSGQLADEQLSTLIFAAISMACLVLTVARFRRYRSDGRAKVVRVAVLGAMVLAANAIALWNLHTATGRRLF